jgi:hypothetical protein
VRAFLPDESCGSASTLRVILAVPTYDGEIGPANAIVASIADLAFDDVADLVVELRLRPDASVLPTAAEIRGAYDGLVTIAQAERLDGGTVDLEFTLVGDETGSAPPMGAAASVSLDPAVYGDEWIRVRIPREGLVFFTERRGIRVGLSPAEAVGQKVTALRLEARTSSGLTVRELVGEAFAPGAEPELLKEAGVAIALIEIGLATGTKDP